MPWAPGDPWPSSTPGGASSPHWGPYVRLWIRAAIAAGRPFRMGPDANDRLDAGNVVTGAPIVGVTDVPGERLWISLECDALDVDIQGGATSSQGILTKPDAATLTVTLADPEQKYDPLNARSPFAYGGRSRLVPGVPVEAFAEVVDPSDGTWSRHSIFTGTADSWGEDWTPHPSSRTATLVATDETKRFVNMNRPEQAAQGAGETTAQRVQRIVTYYGWSGTVLAGTSSVTLQATTLADSAWELLNRTLDDELGYVYLTTEGELRWVGRDAWFTLSNPAIELGCGEGLHDVLVDTSPSAIDRQMRNAVYASRTGGTMQSAISATSVARYGNFDYQRTDLGLETDVQAGQWAGTLLQLYAFPQIELSDITFRPSIDPQSWLVWKAALALAFLTDLVRIVWAAPDHPERDPIDVRVRVVGFKHTITRRSWEIQWQTIDADALAYAGVIFTLGPHAQDRLTAGYVLG